MTKIHTRAKKKLGLGTHKPHKARIFNWSRKVRPKTFVSEDAAKNYALNNNIKKYELKSVKKGKRFEIIVQG